jgi:hypothetical protein
VVRRVAVRSMSLIVVFRSWRVGAEVGKYAAEVIGFVGFSAIFNRNV